MTPAMMNVIFALGGALAAGAAAIFAAGVKSANQQRDLEKNRGDLNGLGKKYGRMVALLILWADTDEKRKQLAQTVEPPK